MFTFSRLLFGVTLLTFVPSSSLLVVNGLPNDIEYVPVINTISRGYTNNNFDKCAFTTTYTKIGINTTNGEILLNDYTYATTVGNKVECSWSHQKLGYVSECGEHPNIYSTLNLTGTGWKLSSEVQFGPISVYDDRSKPPQINHDRTIATIHAAGWCALYGPVKYTNKQFIDAQNIKLVRACPPNTASFDGIAPCAPLCPTPPPTPTPTPTPQPRPPTITPNPNSCGMKRGDSAWTGYRAHVFQTRVDCEIVTNGTGETCSETRFIPFGSVTDYDSCGLETGDDVGIGCWLVYQTYGEYIRQCNNGGGRGTWVAAGDGPYVKYQLQHIPTKISPSPNTCGIARGDSVWVGYGAHVFQRKTDCEIVTNGTIESCQETRFIPHNNNSCGLNTGDQTGIGCWLAYATYGDYLQQCNNGGGKGTWVSAGDGPYVKYQLSNIPKINPNPNTCNITTVFTGYRAHVFQRLADCDRVTAGTGEVCQKTRFIQHNRNSCGLKTGDVTGIGCWVAYQNYTDYMQQCNNGGGKGTWVGRGDGPFVKAKINSNTNGQ